MSVHNRGHNVLLFMVNLGTYIVFLMCKKLDFTYTIFFCLVFGFVVCLGSYFFLALLYPIRFSCINLYMYINSKYAYLSIVWISFIMTLPILRHISQPTYLKVGT